MRKIILSLAAAIALTSVATEFYTTWEWRKPYKGPEYATVDTAWHADILQGYESRFVDQGKAFDGPCRSTIIRKLADKGSRRGVLYVHGFNDYFFQYQMGDRFVDSGYHFYAVDLRRYGRSRLPWQYPFNIRKQNEYFADIDSALAQMRRDGVTDITLSGHSTGGLTVILYAAERGPHVGVNRVVTNSPFLEWNFPAFMRNVAIPAVGVLGRLARDAKVNQKQCDGYSYSLLRQFHGEWTYNTDWKMIYSPPVTMSWIRAISEAQDIVMRKGRCITVPLLVMHSSRKVEGCGWTPEFQYGDAVLDPFEIARRARRLGYDSSKTEVCVIDSGLHDLILSELPYRDNAYDSIFSFIRRH